jgi:hypothetical protein
MFTSKVITAATVVALAIALATAGFADYGPKSTTGPIPPLTIKRGARPLTSADVVLDVPSYYWHHGCGPTALGMVIGYYDGNGFPDLVPGYAYSQTADVDAMIANDSGNPNCAAPDGDHYQDYSCPEDAAPGPVLADRSSLGGAHVSNCVADFMRTSWSSISLYYGWSYFSDVPVAFRDYVDLVAPDYSTTARNELFGSFTWSEYKAEIDAGRPAVFLVDTNGDNDTDHFATGIGYNEDRYEYAVYDTWHNTIQWFDWRGMAVGNSWGIYGVSLFTIDREIQITLWLRLTSYGSVSYYDFTAELLEKGLPMVGEDVTLTTTKGVFTESGTQTYSTDTGGTGKAYGTLMISETGELSLCCIPDLHPELEECMQYTHEWPPPTIETPFDTLDLQVRYEGGWDRSSGLDWSPDGSKIAGGTWTLKVYSYPEKSQVCSRNIGAPIQDISYSDDVDEIAVADDDNNVITVDGTTGAELTRCSHPDNDCWNLSVDWVETSSLVLARYPTTGSSCCLIPQVSSSSCGQTRCFSFPLTQADLVRVRRHSSGDVVAVSSEDYTYGGSIAVFSSSGTLLHYWQDEVPEENAFYDCDWLPGGNKVVAGGENFAAVYTLSPESRTLLAVDNWVEAVAAMSDDKVAVADYNNLRLFGSDGSVQGVFNSPSYDYVDLAWNDNRGILAAARANGEVQMFNLSSDRTSPILAVEGEVIVDVGQARVTLDGTVSDQTSDYLVVTGAVLPSGIDTLSIDEDGYFTYEVPVSADTLLVEFRAVDFYRQTTVDTTVVVREMDDTPPVAGSFDVDPQQAAPGTSFLIEVMVFDAGSGVDTSSVWAFLEMPDETAVDSLRMYDDGSTEGDDTAGDSVFTCTWYSGGFGDGTYSIEVAACDASANCVRTDNLGTLTLASDEDSLAPLVMDFDADPDSGGCAAVFTFTAKVYDESTSVDTGSVWLHIESPDETAYDSLRMYDDGVSGGDVAAGDSVFTAVWASIGADSGFYWLGVRACDSEANCGRSDNLGSVRILPPVMPDLLIASVSIQETSVSLGESITLEVEVANLGNSSAESVFVHTFLSANSSTDPLEADNVHLGGEYVGPLSPGQQSLYELTMVVPCEATDSLYWGCAYADYNSEIPECNETNNAGISSDSVSIHVDQGDWASGFALPPDGQGLNGRINAITAYNGDIIVGGQFTQAGEISANYVARWDGSTWHPLGSGVNGFVSALNVYGAELIAGGHFTVAGDSSSAYIARWDGSEWRPLGTGMDNFVAALTVYEGELIAGGQFATAGGVSVNKIASWDGAAWGALSSGMAGDYVTALTVFDGDLIAGGRFTVAGGVAVSAIASWDGTAWSDIGGGFTPYGTATGVWALEVHDGNLVAGGEYNNAGGLPAKNVAVWDDFGWSALGAGTNARVRALASYDDDLIVGGKFSEAGGSQVNYIARWDGVGWSDLAGGVTVGSPGTYVLALESHECYLFVGGNFTLAGSTESVCIARWGLPCAVVPDVIPTPAIAQLAPGVPNPFLGTTTISYSIPMGGAMRLTVHDVQGRRIKTLVNHYRAAGWHRSVWDGNAESGVPTAPGIYFVRLEAGGTVRTTRVVRLR